MLKVKLTKISTNQNRLRTNEFTGEAPCRPEVGKSFFMYTDGLEFGTRLLMTSLVEELLLDGVFKTRNSKYKLEIIE